MLEHELEVKQKREVAAMAELRFLELRLPTASSGPDGPTHRTRPDPPQGPAPARCPGPPAPQLAIIIRRTLQCPQCTPGPSSWPIPPPYADAAAVPPSHAPDPRPWRQALSASFALASCSALARSRSASACTAASRAASLSATAR